MYHHGVEQGMRNAYILGEEVGGAIIVGVRSGSGTLFFEGGGRQSSTGPLQGGHFRCTFRYTFMGLMGCQTAACLVVAGTLNQ